MNNSDSDLDFQNVRTGSEGDRGFDLAPGDRI